MPRERAEPKLAGVLYFVPISPEDTQFPGRNVGESVDPTEARKDSM